MSWHLKNTYIFALLCPISNTNYRNLSVMELEFAGDATVSGTRLPTSSREAIKMAIHYVLAEIDMSYESGNTSAQMEHR